MSPGTDFFSMMLRHIHHATASVERKIALYSYTPLDTESSPSSPAIGTRRGPPTLLQSRYGKLILAGVLVAVLFLAGSAADVPSTIADYAGGRGGKNTSPDVPPASSIPARPPAGTPADAPADAANAPATPNNAAEFTLESARAMITKEEYIEAVMKNPVEGTLDLAPIRAKCDSVVFQPGLVWHCELVNGGIGNVGNMWLNCVRYAMEAGASYIILPRIGARSETDLYNLGDDQHSVALDTMYDVDYFLEQWKEACPKMRAVLLEKEVPGIPPIQQAPAIKANRVSADIPRTKELMIDATGWRKGFDAWMADNVPAFVNMSAKEPVRVIQRLALSNWNREAEAPDFASAFPRLFRFPDQMRRLAAATLWNMEKQTGKAVVSDAVLFSDLVLATDDSLEVTKSASLATALGPGRLPPKGFLGAHLRVAEDATKAGWPGYEAQAPAYLDEAEDSMLSVIYLATGSAKHRELFKADAAARQMAVVTKESLLDKAELAELQSLSWDQQAIVDFEVLVHSSRFAGFVRSSFSWVVAIRRSILPEAGIPVITKRNVDGELEEFEEDSEDAALVVRRRGGHARRQEAAPAAPAAPVPIVEKYRDGLSVVVGRFDGMTINAIWP